MKKEKNTTNSAWGGRFSQKVSNLVEEYTQSVSFDKNLYEVDIEGSIAHAKMLAKQEIITQDEAKLICKGLLQVKKEIEANKFTWNTSLEDVHMNIESRLIEIIGEIGKKLHTGRSRNDQVCLDVRLYVSNALRAWSMGVKKLIEVFLKQAEVHTLTLLPGCTHFQPAQPVSFAHHLLAYCAMFQRDYERMLQAEKRARVCPLGAAALGGTTYPLDPYFVAKELGMYDVFQNSMDAVADRDYMLEALFCASTCAMHLSRFCEELIIWSNPQFQFVRLSDRHTTGSSIMPQKKNPDVAEIMRGKTGRIYGNLFNLFTQLKGIPLTYNRDLQEDKEPFFDTDRNFSMSLEVMAEMLEGAEFNKINMGKALSKGFLNATEFADYLVGIGIAFRDAHHITGKTVAYAESKNLALEELSLAELNQFIPKGFKAEENVFLALDYYNAVSNRQVHGGTGFSSVEEQIANIQEWLKNC